MAEFSNECRDCKMKFDTSEQLANHVKKFCINGEYGNIKKLDDKYNMAMRQNKTEIKPSAQGKDPSSLKSYGAFTLDQIKSNLKSQDDDFRKLEDLVLRRREDDMIEEIDLMKRQRAQNRVVNDQDEQVYTQLLQETELKNEREFQAKVERDQIKRCISEMDSWRMSVIEEQKKKELDRLLQERDGLKIKQLQLIDDIIRFTQGHRSFQALQSAARISDNRVVGSAQYGEHKQKLVSLANRREFLESERTRILDNLERIKLGDIAEVRRGGSSYSVRAAQSILDQSQVERRGHHEDIARMKDKIAADTQRIEAMKQQQYPPRPQSNNVAHPQPQSEPTRDPEYNDKVLKDLAQLQREYEQAGGNDPKFLANLENLKKFYKGQGHDPNQPQFEQQTRQPSRQQQQVQPLGFNQQPLQQQQQMVQYDPQMQQMAQQQQEMFRMQQQSMQQQAQLRKKKPKEVDFNDPFENFSRKKEFFLQNNVRGVDLTREEQILLSLTAQEVDSLRQISRIPIGTEIYRFKMEQYKELSTMRAEIEKIIQEQRLQRIRRNFEKKRRTQDRVVDNNKWVDDHRKFIIEDRLRRDFGETTNEVRLYDPSEGLVVHWDYIVGLPRRTKLCQVVFAVYNNMQQQYSPKLIEPQDCEVESANTNRVLIGESNQIFEVPAHNEALLIMEVQFPVSKNLEENLGHTESFAWAQIDLFDQQRQLKRGKFKCPLYLGPTDPSITIEEIAKLEPIPNAWFHVRLTFPNDEEFEQVRSIYPEQTAMEYNIPYIHLRGLFARNYEASIKGKGADLPGQRGDVTIAGQDYKVYENIETFERPKSEQKQVSQVIELNRNRGVRFVIHQVLNYVAKNQMRVMVAVLFDNTLLLDQEGLPVAFNTTMHDPSSQVQGKGRENDIIPLVVSNPETDGMNNKANRSNIITFHEEYRAFYDLIGVALKAQKPMWLGFQLVESLGDPNNVSRSATMGGFDLVAWAFLQMIGPNGNIQVGRQAITLFAPPLRRPPFDPTQATETKIRVDFTLMDFQFDQDQMLEWRSKRRF